MTCLNSNDIKTLQKISNLANRKLSRLSCCFVSGGCSFVSTSPFAFKLKVNCTRVRLEAPSQTKETNSGAVKVDLTSLTCSLNVIPTCEHAGPSEALVGSEPQPQHVPYKKHTFINSQEHIYYPLHQGNHKRRDNIQHPTQHPVLLLLLVVVRKRHEAVTL